MAFAKPVIAYDVGGVREMLSAEEGALLAEPGDVGALAGAFLRYLRDPALRAQYIKGRSEGRDRRDKEPDPNSPFAKLAALKEQLEANAKEPRQT